MNKKSHLVILSLITLFPVGSVVAQQENTYNESVVVKGSYRPVIEESQKISFPAVITDTITRIEHDFQYSITPTRLRSVYDPSRIKAARILGEPTTRLYNNYFRVGMGNYWTPLADLYWSSTRDRLKTYGIRLNHQSSWDKLPDYGANHFGQTDATLFGKYIFKDILQLSTDINYQHDHNLYYGFTDSTLQRTLEQTRDDISLKDYRAKYNLASWNIGIRNMQLDANKFAYTVNLHLSDLWASWGQNEFNYTVSGDMHYGFNIKNQYKGIVYLRAEWDGYSHSLKPNFEAERPLGCIADAEWDTVRGNRHIAKINPYADFIFNGLQFHTGFTAGWDHFTSDTNTIFRFFPDIVVSKTLLKESLVLSFGATGGIDPNNWNTIRLINPYIAPGSEQRATRHYDFTAHLRWNPSKKLELNAEAAYAMLRDDISFHLDPSYALNNIYRPHYVDNNRVMLGADVSFVNDEMITLRAGGHYYHYDLLGTDSIFYRPDWDALIGIDLNYHYKWLFHLEAQLLGKTLADQNQTLPLRYGINAQIEYRHNRALSFFLRADNLAFQRYYYWANYPSQRGLFILGLTYTIPTK